MCSYPNILYNNSMKILILSNLYPPYVLGGYEILCEQVVKHLEQRGHTIHILTTDHESAVGNDHIERTLKVYIPFSQKADFNRAARITANRHNEAVTQETIARIKPDVIFIWSLLRILPGAARVAEASGIPVLYTFNDENIAGYSKTPFSLEPRRFRNWFLDTFFSHGITLEKLSLQHTTCISEVTKQNIISKRVPIPNSRVIYQGIPVERFPKKQGSWGAVHSPVRFLYAGQLHAYKGVHTILEAFQELEKQGTIPACKISIAGTGPQEYIEKLNTLAGTLYTSIDFLGKIPHESMPELYRQHDIFIFPSIWQEPFGLTHLEAMASGLPVISTANGGQGEFLVNRENALVFEPDNPMLLAEAIQTLLQDQNLRSGIAKQGRSTAVEKFSFSRYIDELEAYLKEITHTS